MSGEHPTVEEVVADIRYDYEFDLDRLGLVVVPKDGLEAALLLAQVLTEELRKARRCGCAAWNERFNEARKREAAAYAAKLAAEQGHIPDTTTPEPPSNGE